MYKKKRHIILVRLPLVGMFLFVILFLVATLQYTTGLGTSVSGLGFNFKENYLCDLLDINTLEGTINPAHITARIALTIICFSLILLWFELPKLFSIKSNTLTIMQVTGIISMVILLFLAAGNHDVIIRIAGVFGLFAVISILIELYKASLFWLFLFGFFFLALFLTNYYIYESGILLECLPLIQKITFVICLTWFALLNSMLYLRLKQSNY
jgi:hypothetical protein